MNCVNLVLASLESLEQDNIESANAWIAPFQALIPARAFAGKTYGKKYFGKKTVGKYGLDYLWIVP